MTDFGVVFDCDGTLLDTMEAWHKLDELLFARAGVMPTQEDTDLLTRLTIAEVGVFYHERFGLGKSAHDVIAMIDETMAEYYRTKAAARLGALAFVRGLAERGVPMSIASSSPRPYLLAGLKTAGFEPYFSAIVSVDDVGSSKREPTIYDHACASFGLDRSCIWGFEDSLYALHTLKQAGYRTIAVYDNDIAGNFCALKAEADFVIRSFTELDPVCFPEGLLTWKY